MKKYFVIGFHEGKPEFMTRRAFADLESAKRHMAGVHPGWQPMILSNYAEFCGGTTEGAMRWGEDRAKPTFMSAKEAAIDEQAAMFDDHDQEN